MYAPKLVRAFASAAKPKVWSRMDGITYRFWSPDRFPLPP